MEDISAIREMLADEYKNIHLYLHESVDSTNNECKRMISGGFSGTAVVIARTQTSGRGRRGHTFFSPADTGLYFSVIVQPEVELADASIITVAAAVAVSTAIRNITGKQPLIKWVNDIILDGKKVCGILTEAVAGSIIIGIGINVSTVNFPQELENTAGSLGESVPCNSLLSAVLNSLLPFCRQLNEKPFLEEYIKHSAVVGKNVTYTKDGVQHTAFVEGIDASAGLIVVPENGITDILRSGEISITTCKTEFYNS